MNNSFDFWLYLNGIFSLTDHIYVFYCILFFCAHSYDTLLFDYVGLSFFSVHQTQQPLVSLK